MKVTVFSKGLRSICHANVCANFPGPMFYAQGSPGVYWDDFAKYVEQLFAEKEG